ncbi:acetate--CoA ligase family protein [Bdellovibrionota bacterium FG-2]
MDRQKIQSIFQNAREQGRESLLEAEGLALLETLGIKVPHTLSLGVLANESLKGFGEKIVLKAICPGLMHKTEAGAVKIVANSADVLNAQMLEMQNRLKTLGGIAPCEGFLIEEFVPHDAAMGSEWMFGVSFSPEFGPVVTLSPGGVQAEYLAKVLDPERRLQAFTPSGDGAKLGASGLAGLDLVTKRFRGKDALVSLSEFVRVTQILQEFAQNFVPHDVLELEINPLVVSQGALVAVDVVCRLSAGLNPEVGQAVAELPQKPLEKIQALLQPSSIAIVGVSERMNPGRVILQNILRAGFPRDKVLLIKEGIPSLDGCACVSMLKQKVDLLILAVSAAQIPAIIESIIKEDWAHAIMVIPGGFEEKQGGEQGSQRIWRALGEVRKTPSKGPLINGGNCLGIRSLPGRYNSMFIPEEKLPTSQALESPVALISQSGAFVISRMNHLAHLNPRYSISIGNQMDLTAGDYLEALENDPAVQVFGVYVEGFRPSDGLKFVTIARRLVAQGRSVILYRSGRTSAGALACASHTASVAGDYPLMAALCREAGVLLAESFEDFEDLVRVKTLLKGRKTQGVRLGAISNAGFECVAFADHFKKNSEMISLAIFSEQTNQTLEGVLVKAGVSNIVDIHNPLDITPMCGDEAFVAAARAVILDEGVDAVVVGCVPLTPALSTNGDSGFTRELIKLWNSTTKPWVLVVEGGATYEGFVSALAEAGIPVFRNADRAARILRLLLGN